MSDPAPKRLPSQSHSPAADHQIIVHDPEPKAESEKWYELTVKVQPHHTDYGGIVWHGNYLQWLETARIECLASLGINFVDLVKLGCDLPVVDLSLRYHRPLRLGQTALVKTQMQEIRTVRLEWLERVECIETNKLCVSGKVTLVAIDQAKGKILRQLPPEFEAALVRGYASK